MVYILLLLAINLCIIVRLCGLSRYADITAIAYGKEEVEEKALARLVRENESGGIFSEAALWKSEGKVPVRFEGADRERIVSLYQMKGQQSAVFGEMLTAGRYFTEGEQDVCLLDRETARMLFGSDNVIGMKIMWEDKRFTVCGLLEGKQPLCIVPAKKGTAYDGIAAKKAEKASSSELAFGTLEASLGNVGQQRIDGHLYYMTACLFYFLLTASVLAAAGVKERKKRVAAVLYMVLAAEVILLGVSFASPGSDYLPSYWSDFDFFVELFAEKKLQVQGLLHHQEFVSWQQMFGMWMQTTALETAAAVLYTGYFLRETGGR